MRNRSKGLIVQYIDNLVSNVVNSDPVRGRWYPVFLDMKIENRGNTETFETFCNRMERDEKIGSIINI